MSQTPLAPKFWRALYNKMSHDDICEIAARLTAVPTPVIRQLKMADYMEVAGVVSGFFGDSQPTGGTV